jgi:predicted dehydrogenase
MSRRVSRRRFLQTTAAAGAASLLSRSLSGQEKKLSANDKLAVGMIGLTNQAKYDLDEVVKAGVAIVALCDVDENLSGPARQRFPGAKFYTDYRKLIEQKGLDAVVIGIPDHHHAMATLAALRSGLHVYCEKPLTHTVEEARVVAETAAKHKRVTQMGTQIHAGDNYRRVVELIQSGAIGPVKEVHVWCAKSWGGGDRPTGMSEVPKGLDWDLWLGPAPVRPYVKDAYHRFNWRKWWDFGGGTLADMACHHMDLPFWALRLRHPTKVFAEGTASPHPETAAVALVVTYEFPARGNLPPVTLKWYDGGKRPPHFAEGKLPRWGDGNLFVGEKGLLLADYTKRVLLPEENFKGFQPPRPSIKESIGHHKEWVEACKSGGETTCNFDYAGALTEAVLLGNVSYRCGKPLTWDAKSLKADVADAERFIRKEYRKPWSL